MASARLVDGLWAGNCTVEGEEMFGRAFVIIALNAAIHFGLAAAEEPTGGQRLEHLPESLQELRRTTKFESWSKYSFFSRTLRHHRTVLFDEKWNVVVSESGKSADRVEFVEVIKSPSESSEVEFAIYDFESGKRIPKYPNGVAFPIEGAPDGSKESAPAVCIWCHHEQRPFVSVIPFDQSFQDSMDRVRGRIGIRQSLVDVIPNTHQSKQRLEELNRKMEKTFPGRYSDMRVWLQPTIEGR